MHFRLSPSLKLYDNIVCGLKFKPLFTDGTGPLKSSLYGKQLRHSANDLFSYFKKARKQYTDWNNTGKDEKMMTKLEFLGELFL